MTVTDLLPTLRDFNRTDKLRIVQFLVAELAKDEAVILSTEATYPVWSPHTAFEAADALLIALAEDTARNG